MGDDYFLLDRREWTRGWGGRAYDQEMSDLGKWEGGVTLRCLTK